MERPLGHFERYQLTRALVSCEPILSLVASFPPQLRISGGAVQAAIATLLARHPLLSCVVADPQSCQPSFHSRDVQPVEVLEEIQVEAGSAVEDALLLGIKVGSKLSLETGPLWKVTLLESTAAMARVSGVPEDVSRRLMLSVHHVIADGMGTKGMLEELVALVCAPSPDLASVKSVAAPSLEFTIDIRPSTTQLLSTILTALVLPKLVPYLPPFLRPSTVPIFPGPSLVANAYTQRTTLLFTTLPSTQITALKAVGKLHGVPTLHSLIHGCLVAALVLARTLGPASSIETASLISLRSPTLHPSATGNYVSSLHTEYHDLTPQSSFWALCRSYAARLVSPQARALARGRMGLTAYVPNGKVGERVEFLRIRRDAEDPRRDSAYLSNLGVVAMPDGVDVAWAQNACAVGGCLGMNVSLIAIPAGAQLTPGDRSVRRREGHSRCPDRKSVV